MMKSVLFFMTVMSFVYGQGHETFLSHETYFPEKASSEIFLWRGVQTLHLSFNFKNWGSVYSEYDALELTSKEVEFQNYHLGHPNLEVLKAYGRCLHDSFPCLQYEVRLINTENKDQIVHCLYNLYKKSELLWLEESYECDPFLEVEIVNDNSII